MPEFRYTARTSRFSRSSRAHSCIFTIASSWAKEKSGSRVSIRWIQTVMALLRCRGAARPSRGTLNGNGEASLHVDPVGDADEAEHGRRVQPELPERHGELDVEGESPSLLLPVAGRRLDLPFHAADGEGHREGNLSA